MTGSLRRLVAISAEALREDLIDALTIDTKDYDVVFVESLASAFARIRLTTPELVIVLLDIDDVVACELLAIVQRECERLTIPVVTWASRSPRSDVDQVSPVALNSLYQGLALSMN